jgi:hypothetical protein
MERGGGGLRCLKRSAPEGSFRARGALEGGKSTPYTAWGSLPCRTSQVGLDAGGGRVYIGPESEPKMEIPDK